MEPLNSGKPDDGRHPEQHDRRKHAHHILSQVVEWLQVEKAKKAKNRTRKHDGPKAKLAHAAEVSKDLVDQMRKDTSKHQESHLTRTASDLSDEGMALEELEHILSKAMSLDEGDLKVLTEDQGGLEFPRRVSRSKPFRKASKKLLRKGSTIATSDTEYQEPDIDVPSAEVVLDNSKTLSYSGGTATSETDLTACKKRTAKEKDAWLQFKHEIVRLTHTLRLRGWKRLPLASSGEIDVERLSGAMTNAVYVVSPPPPPPHVPPIHTDDKTSQIPKKPPP